MLRNTLLQLRSNLGRVSAAGLAIVLGVAFVAASLVFAGTMRSSMERMLSAPYLAADIVVSSNTMPGQGTTPGERKEDQDERVDSIRRVDGVATASPRYEGYANGSWEKGQGAVQLNRLPQDQQLRWYELSEGEYPAERNQVVVNERAANSEGISPGDTIEVEGFGSPYASSAGGEQQEPTKTEVTVSGLVDTGRTLLTGSGRPTLFASPGMLREFETSGYTEIDMVVASGADTQAVLDGVRAVVPENAEVRTGEQAAERQVEQFSASASVALNAALLPFGAIALFVAGFVIVNTFSVLHAQRRRQYALLRCVGATRGQIRRSALAEALIIGVVSSVIGTALGILAVPAVGWPIGLTDSPADLGALGMTPWAFVVPLLAGVLVTFLAALAPAARAIRVPPLAALRPVADEQSARRIGRVRLVLAVVLTALGGALLFGGAVLGVVLLAAVGAAIAAVGVLLFTPTLIPAVAKLIGRLFRVFGPTGVLATGNAVRNPYRASSTSTALMIGVGLLVVLMTGAATAERSAVAEIDRNMPVDAQVSSASRDGAVPDGLAANVRAMEGTASSAELSGARTGIDTGEEVGTPSGKMPVQLLGVDPAKLSEVARHGGDTLEQGKVLVNPDFMSSLGWSDGQRVELSAGPRPITVRVAESEFDGYNKLLLSETDLRATGLETKPMAVWARASAEADLQQYASDLQEISGTDGDSALSVGGAAPSRASVMQVLNVMLLVLTGLLGVAVIIAVVGIANTLGLSVIERGRESALLRALGLTRGQLRGTLALEAILLALVGAVLGAVLGVVFAWGGVAAVLGQTQVPVALAVPWWQVALVLACSIPVGILASVLPARRAVRAVPAAALAEE
ncbi:putative ABC transport system permease protein [Actinopolyspora biskrensis]|uniref:Putative ABC transport system permease protein n=1 Tax=Actinopolyspora biskrensis TaxID=1470178 RepID=A0A852Z1L1_9ACTN|nr:FtsX-like permease family protein [Actinopolyspora biskrensis]NYH79165.1 putative ABC transport system permease protein [Actinopolyspora biskrensis]